MSPEKFYDEFSKTMLDNNTEKLENLCKEPFLKKLFEFYDFSKKEKNYKNIKEQIEKRKKEHENKEEGEDNNEEEDINTDANKIKSDDSDIDMD